MRSDVPTLYISTVLTVLAALLATGLILACQVPEAPAAAVSPAPAAPPAETWAARGLLTDACQCRVFCPCEMADKPTFGHCKDTAILHIEEGHYGDVNLDGQRVVVVSRSPDDERLVDTVGRLVFAHLYISDEASDAQADALVNVARRVFGTWVDNANVRLSEHETVQKVPLEVVIEAHRHKVKIPGKLSLDVEALVGWDGENPVRLTNGPAAGPGHGDILVARSHEYQVTDHGLDWDFPGRSASMRQIDLHGRIDDAPPAPQPVDAVAALPPSPDGSAENHDHGHQSH